MTAQLAPNTIFRSWDNLGLPLVGGKLNTYIAGTTTPQATYTDSTQGTPNTNPVILNFRGEAFVWLDPALTYKFVLTDALNNLIWTEDNIPGGFGANPLSINLIPNPSNTYTLGDSNHSWANVYLGPNAAPAFDSVSGNIGYYARTAAEISAGVTPTNFTYAPGKVDRYGTNTTPGTTNMRAAFQAAINQARNGGVDVTWGDTGLYLIGDGTSSTANVLDCTFTGAGAQYGITFRQVGTPGINLPTSTRAGILVNHSAYTVFDLTGTSEFKFYDLSLVTNAGGVYPKTCFLTARNSTGESNFPRFNFTTVAGYFSVALLYNYASEDGVYVGNNWINLASDAGACLVVITSRNYFKGSANFMTSAFTTIYNASISCIDHEFLGGQYVLQNGSTTSDLFYIDTAQNVKVHAPWLAANLARSYFYLEGANAFGGHLLLSQVQGEVGAPPHYGILFSNNAGTPSDFSLRDVNWDVSTASVGTAGASPTIDNLRVSNLQENATKGILISGTLQTFVIDYGGTITIGTGTGGWIFGNSGNITITTNSGVAIYDRATNALLLRGGIGTNGVSSGASQLTGWGTPINGAVVNNFAGSSATLVQCGQAITELIIQLKASGILGA